MTDWRDIVSTIRNFAESFQSQAHPPRHSRQTNARTMGPEPPDMVPTSSKRPKTYSTSEVTVPIEQAQKPLDPAKFPKTGWFGMPMPATTPSPYASR